MGWRAANHKKNAVIYYAKDTGVKLHSTVKTPVSIIPLHRMPNIQEIL